jgi:hypothetical protein
VSSKKNVTVARLQSSSSSVPCSTDRTHRVTASGHTAHSAAIMSKNSISKLNSILRTRPLCISIADRGKRGRGLMALKSFERGSTIWKELPLAAHSDRRLGKYVCPLCFAAKCCTDHVIDTTTARVASPAGPNHPSPAVITLLGRVNWSVLESLLTSFEDRCVHFLSHSIVSSSYSLGEALMTAFMIGALLPLLPGSLLDCKLTMMMT